MFPKSKEDFDKCFESPENFYEKLLKENSIEKIDVKYLKVDALGYINIVKNSENNKLDTKAENELRDRIQEVSQGYMRYLGETLKENNKGGIFPKIQDQLRKQMDR